ncbi:MAG: alpha/beta hydrolase [Calditrichia bacterium]
MRTTILVIVCFVCFGLSLSAQEIQSTEKLPEVVISGTGETTMLLIGCMSCRWNAWEEFMARNEDRYTMYAVTVPGYGGTSAPDLPVNTKGTPWRDHLLAGLSELLDKHELTDVVVMGHSWGTMVAVQLADLRQDIISKVVSVDGTIESSSWVPDNKVEQIEQANSVIENYGEKLQNAEEWSKFNGAAVGNTFGKTDSVSTERMNTRIKLISSFMATNRQAMLQYWRENLLVDLSASLIRLKIPVLDIQSFTGEDQLAQKKQHLETLRLANAPDNVQSVFMFDTKHFIMYHRPLVLDKFVADFIKDKPIADYVEPGSFLEEDLLAN